MAAITTLDDLPASQKVTVKKTPGRNSKKYRSKDNKEQDRQANPIHDTATGKAPVIRILTP
jgi:hypothetical protein